MKTCSMSRLVAGGALAALLLLPAPSASAATCSFAIEGLNTNGMIFGSNYSVKVNFVYTWTTASERPTNGASAVLFEFDATGSRDEYGTDVLPPPPGAGNASGSWNSYVFYSKVPLSDGMDDDDLSFVIDVRCSITMRTPAGNRYFSTSAIRVPLIPDIPDYIKVPASSLNGKPLIEWGLSEGSGYYEVQRKTDTLGYWQNRFTGVGNDFDFTDALSSGHVYYYRVRGVNPEGKSSWRTGTNGCQAPVGIPATLKVPATDLDGAFPLSWGPAAGANGYELQEQDQAAAIWFTVYSGGATGTALAGRKIGHTYAYRVRGVNSVSGLRGAWRLGSNLLRVIQPGAVAFKAASVSVTEGTASVVLAVVRTNGSDGAASVSYKTVNKTALAGQDYTAREGMLVWHDGDASEKVITVPILNDTVTETGEVFKVSLFNPTGAALGFPRLARVRIPPNTKEAEAGEADGGDPLPAGGMETALEGPGTLAFDWRFGGGAAGEALVLTDNGEPVASTEGTTGWERVAATLSKGPHLLRWAVAGPDPEQAPSGAAYLGEVVWTPGD